MLCSGTCLLAALAYGCQKNSATAQPFISDERIEQLSYALLEPLFPVTKGIRLLGITMSSLGEKQLESEP
jgi:hypothetical protein